MLNIKNLLTVLLVASSVVVFAQTEISTPVGQSLRVKSDSMYVNAKMKGRDINIDSATVNTRFTVNSGIIMLNNTRFLSTTGTRNTFGGANAGILTLTGGNNTVIGAESGQAITSAWGSTFIGARSGRVTAGGSNNTFVGLNTGLANVGGSENVFVGRESGLSSIGGDGNVLIGSLAGSKITYGDNNVAIGKNAGYSGTSTSSGSGNVFIGNEAGQNETGSNKLYISNSNTTTPIILGDFSNGKLGFSTANYPTSITATPIGGGSPATVSTTNYKLFVKGGILTEAITVASGWADYVFEQDYKLKPLADVETFIRENGHLPNVPSAAEVEKLGINVADMARIQQEKIEELTLYVIDLKKEIEMLKSSLSPSVRRRK